MKSFSVYEAKARFSEVLRLVRDRGEVVITQHGRRVARILPFEDVEGEESIDERLARLAAAGLLQRASQSPKGLPARARVTGSSGALRRFLDERG